MNELVKLELGQTMTSLEIAELIGKAHFNIMRDIRKIVEQIDNENEINFELVNYVDAKGESRPMYKLTKKGCLCLAAGYDANLRMKIINRWEELELKERAALPSTYAAALRQLAEEVEAKEEIAKQLEEKRKELDESKEWYTIKRWAAIHGENWRKYNWRELKRISIRENVVIKKVFDANYGEVNLYHRRIFEIYETF